jgi:3-hydroxyisobutyrate dehydrogenase-like beta-hydroxyacid dehydrogenase
MTAVPDESTDVTLTRAVREVQGVTDVFSPASAVGYVPQVVTALVTGDADAINRVRVRSADRGTEIATRIAVDHGASTPDTARRVADALLAGPAEDEVTVVVQVSRIS